MHRQTEIHVSHSIESNIYLSLYYCGKEKCAPAHSWGPFVRDHYLIHYINNGKGTFHVGDKVYHLHKGQGFLICPGILTTYTADFDDPWEYYWVGFNGLNAADYLQRAGLAPENPVFTYRDGNKLLDCIKQMLECSKNKKSGDLRYISLLYMFLSLLIDSSENRTLESKKQNIQEDYIKKAIQYIHINFCRKISINELASYVGLSRKYLFFLFKKYLGISPQQYLINFRIKKACELLENSDFSIHDISRSVGYENQLLFSKTFHKAKGMPPTLYRKQHERTQQYDTLLM